MGVKLWSVTIANMIVWVLTTLLLTVTASPLHSLTEIDHLVSRREAEPQSSVGNIELKEIVIDSKAQDKTAVASPERVPSGAIAAILAAAKAGPAAINRGPGGYGKRSTDTKDESETNNFIPFSVYDDRRVKTLKLEQNDFLALPER